MAGRIRRGVALTGACNFLAGLLSVIGPVNYSMSRSNRRNRLRIQVHPDPRCIGSSSPGLLARGSVIDQQRTSPGSGDNSQSTS